MARGGTKSESESSSGTEAEEQEQGREPGPRAFWSGTLTFGLVSVPVELYAARRASGVSLRSLSPSGHPLRREYVCPAHGRALERDEIVRGHPVGGERFVTVTEDELQALQPERSREIDLRRFVPRSSIDPIYCNRAYFLLPPGELTKPYRLLAAIMERTGQAGIATFVMRGRSYVIAIFAEGGVLRAETLRHADEVRSVEEVGLPAVVKAPAAQVKAIRAAIRDAAADELDLAELRDEQAQALRARAEQKAAVGEDVVEMAEVEAEAATNDVLDLMALLKARLGIEQGEGEPVAGAKSGQALDLDALTKKELYARAQARDVEGRSAMSKQELIEALAG